MRFYGLKTCDTCRKALKALVGQDITYIDVREDGIAAAVLEQAYAKFGAAMVNKSSTTWRGLSDAEKAKPPLDLLKAHPTLMKRPLIVDGARITLGWKADVQALYQ